MSRAPRLTGKQLIAALNRAGFEVIRVKGSHHFEDIMTDAALLFRCTRVKRSAQVCYRKCCGIVTSR